MQPRFMVAILVLKPERLVRRPVTLVSSVTLPQTSYSPNHSKLPSLSVISRGMPMWSQWK